MTTVLYLWKRISYSNEIYTEVFRGKRTWCIHLNLKSFREISIIWIHTETKKSREILLIGVRGTLFLKIKDKEHVGVPFTLATFLYIGNLLAFASFRKKQVSSKDSTVTNTWGRIIIVIEFFKIEGAP